MDKDLSKVISSWDRHHRSTIFRDREKDLLGLDVVCVPGYPLAYNNMLHFFQKRAHNTIEKKMELSGGKIHGMNVLDMGCGTGRWCQKFQKKGAIVTGVDISQSRLDDNKKRLPKIIFKKMSVTKLNFADNTFDIINISWVLQHNNFHLQEESVKEMFRVLKKNGYIFFMEGAHEKEFPVPKYSFPRTTPAWINLFEKYGGTIIHKEKILETFLTDFYVKQRNMFVNSLRPWFGLTDWHERGNKLSDEGIYEFLENKEIQKKRKYKLLRKTYRFIDQTILTFLSYTSYIVEYFNIFIFQHFPEGTLVLLIKKK